MSPPSNWSGFGVDKGKLKIGEGDVMIIDGTYGHAMKLSDDLKIQLCKPWANALILKVIGRLHSLNFMLSRLRQIWKVISHWQLTDLENGYFVARFQMYEDFEFVLTGVFG